MSSPTPAPAKRNDGRARIVWEMPSRLKFRPRHTALANDRQLGADSELGMIRYWNGDRSCPDPALHHDVTASPSHLRKSMLFKNPTDLAS